MGTNNHYSVELKQKMVKEYLSGESTALPLKERATVPFGDKVSKVAPNLVNRELKPK